jgi:hypothetical protein
LKAVLAGTKKLVLSKDVPNCDMPNTAEYSVKKLLELAAEHPRILE